jgi:hypothetical protein
MTQERPRMDRDTSDMSGRIMRPTSSRKPVFQLRIQFVLIGIKAADRTSAPMNDFLRPCNCVHPAEEDCEKCIEDAAVIKSPVSSDEKPPQKPEPKLAESKKPA